ncbi:MAG TPA: hypothetical protein EYP22_05090 [Methanosarcinales archaeon]|nr:hypothetical protein [Methanosarcinales archaeon]
MVNDPSEYWNAVEAVRKLNELHSKLDSQIREIVIQRIEEGETTETRYEEVITLTIGEIKDIMFYDIIPLLPSNLKEIGRNIYDSLPADRENELVRKGSDIDNSILELLDLLYEYLKDNWNHLHLITGRILQVWPPESFDFRNTFDDLNIVHISPRILNYLKYAISAFIENKNREVIINCRDAYVILIDELRKYMLDRFFINFPENKEWYNKFNDDSYWSNLNPWKKLEGLREALKFGKDTTLNPDQPPSSYTKNRLEWYILFLLQIIYWLRNAEAHVEERNSRLPNWMNDHRKIIVDSVEHARLCLICTLQVTKEFQKLLENKSY